MTVVQIRMIILILVFLQTNVVVNLYFMMSCLIAIKDSDLACVNVWGGSIITSR